MDFQPIIDFALRATEALLLPIAIAGGASIAQRIKINAQTIKFKNSESILESVNIAIMAAEQQGKAGILETNTDKKAFAMNAAMRSLETKKIKVDAADLDTLIEAQVWDVFAPPPTANVVPSSLVLTTIPDEDSETDRG